VTEEESPTSDLSAEQSVLGGMLLAGEAADEVFQIIGERDFASPKHAAVYRSISRLRMAGIRVDPVLVSDDLARHVDDHTGRTDLAMIGGAPYLHTLIATVPTAANASYYAEIVRNKSRVRRLVGALQRGLQVALAGVRDVDEMEDFARSTLDEAIGNRKSGDGVDVGELALLALDRYAAPRAEVLATGWHDLDDLLEGGVRPGNLVIVGARPSVGKSIIGLNLAVRAAKLGQGALFASLEMSRDEVIDRVISQVREVELSHLTRSHLTADDWERIQDAVDAVQEWPLRIEDTAQLSLARLRALAKERARKPSGLGLIVADYLQLMRAADSRMTREQQVAQLSRELKLLAKDMQVPVVALSQLNRAVEGRSDKKPGLADLRESGSIEQDADVVLMLWADPERTGERQVAVVKNRQGRIGDVRLSWAPHYASVRNLETRWAS
jgi:replicative DNA helicase